MFVSRCSYARSASVSQHDLVDVDHRPRRLPLPGKRQQVADDARGALRLAEDDVDAAARVVGSSDLFGEPLGPAQDRRQRVVQFVRDAEIVWPSAAIFSACSSC